MTPEIPSLYLHVFTPQPSRPASGSSGQALSAEVKRGSKVLYINKFGVSTLYNFTFYSVPLPD
jgi:hypothetical protein